MFLKNITPFKQLVRGYAALLRMGDSLERLAAHAAAPPLDYSALLRMGDSLERLAHVAAPRQSTVLHDMGGYRLLLDQTSLVDRMVIEKGEWEGPRVRYLIALAERFRGRPQPVFLDLGSYWGYYSLMLHGTGIFEQIYAFEADAYNYAQLQANIFLNKLDGIIVAHNAAVSDAPAELAIQDSRSHQDGNRSATRLLKAEESAKLPRARRVKAVAVDDIISIQDSHLVIKMDVEAHEAHALRGMRNLIRNNKVILQLEIYREQTDGVAPVLRELDMRLIRDMYPDFFYTNIRSEDW
jgi:FkbM family methyltransferase